MYADVILPLPLDGEFTYHIPTGLEHEVQAGCRVLVPFGKKKVYTAIVLRLHNHQPQYATKDILELLDTRPTLLPLQLELWQWMARYYLCPLGDVMKAALPSGMKLESETTIVACPDFCSPTPLRAADQALLASLGTGHSRVSDLVRTNQTGQNVMNAVHRLMEMGAVMVKEEVRRQYKPRRERLLALAPEYMDQEKLLALYDTLERRSPRQFEILTTLLTMTQAALAIQLHNPQLMQPVARVRLLEALPHVSGSALDALRAKGVIAVVERTTSRLEHTHEMPPEILLNPLSPPQQQAFEQIGQCWQSQPVCLLHGVTSSGKTEVYTHLIHQALTQGKQVLYLLPEIVLTTQLTQRLRRIFGPRLGVYHSRYPDAERVEVYQKMLSDEPYQILLGVRSSVFLPFQRLGLVIVDEEHEQSFKQQDPAPRYHARNVALMLARHHRARVLLGSATPSLESYHNATTGKYGLVRLCTRFGDVQLPRIEVVDVKEMQRKRLMQGPFSPRLLQAIGEALEHDNQVILFQNRRGYSPTMECPTCGWTPRCQQCDVSLTYHKAEQRLVCHYCGAQHPLPTQCPACLSTEIRSHGYGTERIEGLIAQHFPQARVGRMDLDTTRSRQSYEQLLESFERGQTHILVGTQMVTKGLDFDRVSLVGILNADTMLNQPDFRAYERSFQLMAQVAGRAGRRGQQGLVILQTRDAQSPVVRQVVDHDYEGFFRTQTEERRLFQFPPHCRLVYVYLKHRDEHTANHLAQHLAQVMRQVFGERVMGPDAPFVARVQLMHIRKVVLKLELTAPIAEARQRLLQIQQYILAQPQYHAAQFYYDVE